MDAVLYAAANTAEDFPGGITGMAAAIGKNKFSLAHELSETGTAKLGLRDALKMVNRAKDWRIISAACEVCGGVFVPLPESLLDPGNDLLKDLGRMAGEFGDVVREVSASAGDSAISDNEMVRLEREWGELVAAGVQMMGHLRARHDAAKLANVRTLRAA
jgi:hypothetical protein